MTGGLGLHCRTRLPSWGSVDGGVVGLSYRFAGKLGGACRVGVRQVSGAFFTLLYGVVVVVVAVVGCGGVVAVVVVVVLLLLVVVVVLVVLLLLPLLLIRRCC